MPPRCDGDLHRQHRQPGRYQAEYDLYRLLALTYVLARDLEQPTPTDGRGTCDNPARDVALIAAGLVENVLERIMRLLYELPMA